MWSSISPTFYAGLGRRFSRRGADFLKMAAGELPCGCPVMVPADEIGPAMTGRIVSLTCY
jgi:hypothetical protein